MKPLVAVLAFTLVACAAPDSTAPTVQLPHPAFGVYDATRPAPELLSAERIGPATAPDAPDTIRVTFTETATDAALISAYATGGSAPATQNIAPSGALGLRVEDVLLWHGETSLALRYLWTADLSDPALNIWGPFSAFVPITDAVTAVTTNAKKKGKR